MSLKLDIVSHSEKQTLALATRLAPYLRRPDVVVLSGELGSGKTLFVHGLASALEIDEQLIHSPSFTMVNEYPSRYPLFHFDLYRLTDPSELYELGWDDYLQREGLVVVEWGEKAGDLIPDVYYRICFTIVGEHRRRISVSLVKP